MNDTEEEIDISASKSIVRTETLSRSFEILPDTRLTVEELQIKITNLSTNLASTENELDDKILENEELKTQITKLTKENTMLKTICKMPIKAAQVPKNQKKSHSFYHTRKHTSTPLKNSINLTQNFSNGTENKLGKLKEELEAGNRLITILKEEIKRLNDKVDKLILASKADINIETHKALPKLCLISSNNRNKIIETAIDTLKYRDICHYSYPGAATQSLLDDLPSKIDKFGPDDYCIIFIGEADFRKTNNYHTLIECVKKHINEFSTH